MSKKKKSTRRLQAKSKKAPLKRKGILSSSRHRKHRLWLPYPIIVLLLIIIGICLAAWSWQASADQYVVTAEVKATAPTQPAVITSPTSGQSFTNYLITVSGTCPANASYVEIVDNNFMNGSAICSAGNTFDLSISLFRGANQLVADAFDITNDEGPPSNPVNVTFSSLAQTTPTSSFTKPFSGSPLEILAKFTYQGYYVGQAMSWPFQVIGGVAPYAIDIEWGDGTNTLISSKTSQQLSPTHTYSNAGGFRGSYTIKVYVTDSLSNNAYYQAFLIINAGKAPAKHILPPISSSTFSKIEKIAWPLWGILLLLVISFWLGEREEYAHLGRRHRLKKA
jgi:hypothetical protein